MGRRLGAARIGRLATITSDGRPHLVPCCFAFDGSRIVTAVDGKPKSTTALRRLDNIRSHPAVTLLVDHYDDRDWDQLWWVRADGLATVIDAGPERDTAVSLLVAKYPQYRVLPPPGPVIVMEPTAWRGWP